MKTTELAFRIRKLREYRAYTQTYMAGRLGIRQNTYSLLENGAQELKPDRLELIADILNVDIQVLLAEEFELYSIDKPRVKAVQEDASQTMIIQQMNRIIRALEEDVQYLRNQNIELLKVLHHDNYLPAGSQGVYGNPAS